MLFQIAVIKIVKEMRKISNHNIAVSEYFDKVKSCFRKMNITFMEICAISYSNI